MSRRTWKGSREEIHPRASPEGREDPSSEASRLSPLFLPLCRSLLALPGEESGIVLRPALKCKPGSPGRSGTMNANPGRGCPRGRAFQQHWVISGMEIPTFPQWLLGNIHTEPPSLPALFPPWHRVQSRPGAPKCASRIDRRARKRKRKNLGGLSAPGAPQWKQLPVGHSRFSRDPDPP